MNDQQHTSATAQFETPTLFVKSLLLTTLLVLLNTPLIVTRTTKIDQYSLYANKWLSEFEQMYVAIVLNLVLVVIAFVVYLGSWEIVKRNFNQNRRPLIAHILVVVAPVLITFGPSLALSHTGLKPYFLIISIVIIASFAAIGSWSSSSVSIDHRTSVSIMNSAAIAITLLAVGAIGSLCNLPPQQQPPASNLLHTANIKDLRIDYSPDNIEEFSHKYNDSVRFFLIVSILFGTALLGGALLYSLYTNRQKTYRAGITRDELIEGGRLELLHLVSKDTDILDPRDIPKAENAQNRNGETSAPTTGRADVDDESKLQPKVSIIVHNDPSIQPNGGVRIDINTSGQAPVEVETPPDLVK